jgi:hypothetical protein
MRGRRSVASGVRFAALMLMTFMITFLVGLVAGESSGGSGSAGVVVVRGYRTRFGTGDI